MELFVTLLIVISIVSIITIILLALTINALAPFRKMKEKDLDECYDMKLRRYKKK